MSAGINSPDSIQRFVVIEGKEGGAFPDMQRPAVVSTRMAPGARTDGVRKGPGVQNVELTEPWGKLRSRNDAL